MRVKCTLLFCLFLFIAPLILGGAPLVRESAGLAAGLNGGDNDFVPGEVVVKLASTTDLTGVAAQFYLDPAPLGQFGSRPIYRLRITDTNAKVQDKVTALIADPQKRVIYAEPNFLVAPPE